jgi:dienelactone hydrolase
MAAMQVCVLRSAALAVLALSTALAALARADSSLLGEWPAPDAVAGISGEPVTYPSISPFTLTDLDDPADIDRTRAKATLFMPPGKHAPRSVPAVIMLHGSSGVLPARELTYGPQLAQMGVAALVVDAFGARRDRGTSFTERLLNITETMLMADAYRGLGYLAGKPEIDPKRVVLIGFSYGAMATMYALNGHVADRLAPQGLRFAGHVAFYGPCIAYFDDPRTTGAPLLMLYGTADEIVDAKRCAALAGQFRTGGSTVDIIAYPGAVHQWDGAFARRLIGRNLAPCRFEIERDGSVRDDRTGLPMSSPFWRKIELVLCVEDRPYPIGRDDAVRAQSNRDLGRFLAKVFGQSAS